jgi:recombination endonuclease VII/HNH endonuclease
MPKTPGQLWHEAGEDPERYRELMREAGHISGPCIEWGGPVNTYGYGRRWVKRDGRRVLVYLHREAYENTHGPIAPRLIVQQSCLNRRCFNVDHLEAMTMAERNRRSGLRVTVCPKGHQYGNGPRKCRACNRDRQARRRAAMTTEQRMHAGLRYSARRLGLDPDVIEARLVAHNGLCEICGRRPAEAGGKSRQRLCIDHDHTTGTFRGLLCESCNLAIGQMGDDPERLYAAAEYLLKATAMTASLVKCECPCHADGKGHCEKCRPRLPCGWPGGAA